LELREGIATDGFDEERGREVLQKIYGSPEIKHFDYLQLPAGLF